MPDMNAAWVSAQGSDPGRTVAAERTDAQQAYTRVLEGQGPGQTLSNGQGTFTGIPFNGYWSVGPGGLPAHRGRGADTASGGQPGRRSGTSAAAYAAAMDDEDSQYRTVTSHFRPGAENPAPGPVFPFIKVAGLFDPARIRAFDPLSQVPLGDLPAGGGDAGRPRPAAGAARRSADARPEPGRPGQPAGEPGHHAGGAAGAGGHRLLHRRARQAIRSA